MTSRFAKLLIPATAAALVLTGCAAAPDSSPTPSGSAASYCARMVTDSSPLLDSSFNESAWNGLLAAQTQLGIDVNNYVSNTPDDHVPNVEQAVATGCQFVLATGYGLVDALESEAPKSPDVHFAIIDDDEIDLPNVKPIVFDTAEASYLAGYVAAGVSKTHVVATYGGDNEPAVDVFMDGFVDGVAKYNAVHGTDVKVLGWDKAAQDGSFINSWEDTNLSKTTTENFIAQGADVILPVAGDAAVGTFQAALEQPGVLAIGVDTDEYLVDKISQYKSVLLTSVVKNSADAIPSIISDDIAGKWSNEPYVGTLANGGVSIAPYHDLESTVGSALAAEVQDLQQQIVDGKIVVTSPSSPINKG